MRRRSPARAGGGADDGAARTSCRCRRHARRRSCGRCGRGSSCSRSRSALFANLLPLSGVALALRPDFLALVLLYWCIQEPRYVGVGIAWFVGLLMDVGDGTLFGQHALAYAVLAYAAEYFRRRVLRFPLWQQAAQVAVLLLLCAALVLADPLRRRRAAAALDLRGAVARRRAAVARRVGRAAVAAAPAALVRALRDAEPARRRWRDDSSSVAQDAAAMRGGGFGSPELRNPERELFLFRRRLGVAGVLVLAAFGALFARFFYLQVVQHRHYQTLAETNRIAIVPIVPNRGVITDRNGVVLAQSYSAYTLEIQPSRVKNLDETIDALADDRRRAAARPQALPQAARGIEELREPAAAHAAHRRGGRALRRQPLPLPGRRDQGAAVPPVPVRRGRLARRRLHRPHQRPRRRAHRASGTRPPTTRAPTTSARSASSSSYERELHGTTGFEEVEVDAGGRAVRTLSRTPPISGNDLKLSLDIKLQEVAEKAFGERRGALVAIEPATGDVLAFVSKPGLRPEPVRRRHRLGELGAAERFARQAAAQPAAARRLSARLDDQAVPRARRAHLRQAHAGADDLRSRASSRFPGRRTASATTSRAATARSTCTSRSSRRATPTTTCSRARPTSTTPRASCRSSASAQKTGIDIEGELTGVLPSREWKRQRFAGKDYRDEHRKWYLGDSDLGRHRPGLQRVHADPARARDRDHRQRRRRLPPASREERPRACAPATCARSCREPSDTADGEARAPRGRQERARRRATRKARARRRSSRRRT